VVLRLFCRRAQVGCGQDLFWIMVLDRGGRRHAGWRGGGGGMLGGGPAVAAGHLVPSASAKPDASAQPDDFDCERASEAIF
jgi:hypothetical protein